MHAVSVRLGMGQIDLFTVYDAPLGWGANTAKITVNVWDFGPLGTAITPLQRRGFPQRKCILKDICTVIILIKYKEKIQVTNGRKRIFKISYPPNH